MSLFAKLLVALTPLAGLLSFAMTYVLLTVTS